MKAVLAASHAPVTPSFGQVQSLLRSSLGIDSTINPRFDKTIRRGPFPRPESVESSVDFRHILDLLRLAGLRHRVALARRLGLSLSEELTLEYLQRYGPRTTGDLAALLVLSPSAITLITRRLERIGHLARGPHPADRRKTLLVPTAQALLAAEQELAPFVEDMLAVHQALSSLEAATIADFVGLAVSAIERAADALARNPVRSPGGPETRDLGVMLHLLQLAGMRHHAALARRLGWTPMGALALEHLQRYGPMSPGELAGLLSVSPSAIGQMTKHLQRAGGLARHAHPVDRRKTLLSSMPAAAEAMRAELMPFARDLAELGEKLSPEQGRVVWKFLADTLERTERAADALARKSLPGDLPSERGTA